MKKMFLMIALMAVAFIPAGFAQTAEPSALVSYYQVKDALVAGNAAQAAEAAATLVKSLPAETKISKADKTALTKTAGLIAASNDLKAQRESFAPLSDQVIGLVKKKSIATDEAFVQYCPMKKASWLSTASTIRNPYYGDAMLTCGSVKETLKK